MAVSFTFWFDLHMVGFISFLFFQLSAAFDCRCALKLCFHGIPSGQMVYFRPHSLISGSGDVNGKLLSEIL